MHLNESEIELRKPVWIALSDLFLDKDATSSYEYIVSVCAESKYSTDELEAILKKEVAPVVSANLLSMAGAWSGFDNDWLVEEICKNIHSKSILKLLIKYRFNKYINEHWQNILQKIIEAREM
jgi:hypothetical protein